MRDRQEPATPDGGGSDTLALLAAAALLLLMRAHAWPAPLETDECNYLYIGQRLAAGDWLYVDVWDHQPPAVYVLTRMLSHVGATGAAAYRAVCSGVSMITLALVYFAARRGLGRGPAALSAILFALCCSDPGTAGEGGNRELFMNPLILGAFLLLLGGRARRWGRRVLVAGGLLGIASGFKTVAAAQWLTMLVWLLTSRPENGTSPSARLADAARFAVGPAAIWLFTWGWFATTGRSGEFLDAVFIYNLGYSGIESSVLARFGDFFTRGEVFRSAWALWVLGGAGLILLPWRASRRFSLGVAFMTLGSCLAVCLPGRFWPHYYYLLLPWLAIAAGTPLAHISGSSARKWAVGAMLAVLSLASQYRYYLRLEPDEIARFRYGPRMAWARDQGKRLAEVAERDDTVYVFGSDAGIYYYSKRRCATRFTMIEAVSAEREGVRRRRQQFMDDFRRSRPRVVLITEEPFPELVRHLQTEYEPAGWDRGAGPDRPPRMQVLADRQRPIEAIDWDWIDK